MSFVRIIELYILIRIYKNKPLAKYNASCKILELLFPSLLLRALLQVPGSHWPMYQGTVKLLTIMQRMKYIKNK